MDPEEQEREDDELERLELSIEREKIQQQREQLQLWREALNQIVPAVTEYYKIRMERVDVPVFRTSTFTFAMILLVIVVGCGTLVFFGKLGESNFTFLLGIVLGYLMNYIRLLVGGAPK